MRFLLVAAGLVFSLVSATDAQPLRVLAIGDSLTEEYRFETPFSAPVGGSILEANTRNWPEILAAQRPDAISLGSYNANLASYPDFRNGGYRYNYGIPGFTAEAWVGITESSAGDIFDGPYEAASYATKTAISRHLAEDGIGVVVIFLGGNDLNSDYDLVFESETTPPLLTEVVSNLRKLWTFVRSRNATVPIVICTLPDIGATPKVAEDYPDPALRVRARQRIAQANAAVIALANELGSQVARIDSLTDRVYDEQPFTINGSVFLYPPDDANPPDRLFCHDGFHPSTVGQAYLTNLLLDAINRATGRAIPLLTNREILGDVLGLNPDQPYLNWAGSAGGVNENPDGDGLPNLVEYLLNTDPNAASSPLHFSAGQTLSFMPSSSALKFASLAVEESTNLSSWTAVPPNRMVISADGSWNVMPEGSKKFYRLSATPRP